MAALAINMPTPPASSASSPSLTPSKRRRSPNLSIDLSDLPPLIQPSPPSNTLLITNLQAPEIFTAHVLDQILKAINEHAPVRTFSPLKSMRRIICTFDSAEAATTIRQTLDGETVLGSRVRVYFGQETRLESLEDQHLRAPQSQKLFFISPPPSPPMGWEMRNEEPPNTLVHAEDLAAALSRLHARPAPDASLRDGGAATADLEMADERPKPRVVTRARSGTGTVVYDPEEHGHSPLLPAIAVEDTSASPQEMSPMEDVQRRFEHTMRPPIELMQTT